MAARTTKGTSTSGWPAQVRDRIKTSMLLNRLTDHALGKVELQATQVRAIEILLKKTIPDLSQVSGSLNVVRDPLDLSDAELADIAAGRSAHAAATEDGETAPDQVH